MKEFFELIKEKIKTKLGRIVLTIIIIIFLFSVSFVFLSGMFPSCKEFFHDFPIYETNEPAYSDEDVFRILKGYLSTRDSSDRLSEMYGDFGVDYYVNLYSDMTINDIKYKETRIGNRQGFLWILGGKLGIDNNGIIYGRGGCL